MTDKTATQLAEDVLAALRSPAFDVDALVAAARTKLGLEVEGEPLKATEIPDEITLNELLARAAECKRIADAATAEREKIKTLLKDVIGDNEALKVHGAVVATYKTSASRILDQKYIKSLFPDIPGNEEFYTTSGSRTFLFK